MNRATTNERDSGRHPAEETRVSYEPSDDMVESEPLDLGEGNEETVIRQEHVGPGNELGGGEYPDRDTPPADGTAVENRPNQSPDSEVPASGVLDPRSDDPPEPNEPA